MTKSEFEVYPFEEGKFYIAIVDPVTVNLEDLARADWPPDKDIDCMIVSVQPRPGSELKDSLHLISFDSIQHIENWLRELKETKEL